MTAETSEPRLSYVSEQVLLCMLTDLTEDLDQVQLLPAHFETYHSLLRQELPKLYDIIQTNENKLFNDNSYLELRAQLVVLFCELSATPTVYELVEGKYLLQNANKMLTKLTAVCQEAEQSYIFNYYQKKLHKDCWKRHLGAVHGFSRYLEHYHINDVKMSANVLTFSLALGINVRECYLADYKQLGVCIFNLILTKAQSTDIQHLNVHGVIYELVFRDAYSTESVEVATATWNCLYLCLDHFTELDGYTWNQCDDMLERLLQNVTVAPNAQMSICFLNFITKLGYYFTINSNEIKTALNADLTQPEQMSACRALCAKLNVCTNYRWAKSILQMLVLESEKLLQSTDICAQMMLSMQRCYLVCILPIPLQALHVHLSEFYDKFVAVLLESLVVHEKAVSIVKLTQQFIKLFIYQLNNNSAHQLPSNLKDYTSALKCLQECIAK